MPQEMKNIDFSLRDYKFKGLQKNVLSLNQKLRLLVIIGVFCYVLKPSDKKCVKR